MACSIERWVDDIAYAAKRTTESQNSSCSKKRNLNYLSAVWMTACCLGATYANYANAAPELPFIHSLNESGQAQDLGIASQKARIAELENREATDVYAPELREAYLELANDQAAMENHAGALNTYAKALQIVRVNDGLASPNQLPILQAQLDSLEKLQQWSRYDSTLNLIYLVSQDQFPSGDDNRIKVLNQLSKWQLRVAEEGLLERGENKAKIVADLYEKEFREIEASGTANVSDFGISSLHLGKAYTRLSMARIALNKPVSEYRSITSEPTLSGSRCRPVLLTAGDGSSTCMAAPVPNLNFYQVPADRKQQETAFYLEALRTAILDAGETLENKRHFVNRDLLIDEFRFLAESYTQITALARVN